MAGNTIFYQKFGIIPIIFDIRDVVWAYGTRTPLEMPVAFAKEADISMLRSGEAVWLGRMVAV